MITHTIQLHRVLKAPAERVYRAFIDPAAMGKWLPPNGFTATIHHIDAKVGGSFRMSFTNFTGVVQSYTNTVLATINTTIPPATNQARRVFTFRLPASGTITFTPTYPAGTTFGLQISATGAGVYNANIQPLGIQ
jgi:uncharacterized protein YndB with AHSA1/START domain